MRKPKIQGFSLVELLVTIGIVGVLIGVLVPVVTEARQQAKETEAIAIVTDLGTQLAMCKVLINTYPVDVYPSIKPSECPRISWPTTGKLPLNGVVDYENWTWNGGKNRWVGVSYIVGNRIGGIAQSSVHNEKGVKVLRNGKNITILFGIYVQTPNEN